MLMTGSATTNTVIPYWNEIKNWNREDRSKLAELLAVSLEEEEPMEDSTVFTNEIPAEALMMAAEYAIRESRAGHAIPHEQAMDWIKQKRGWK